MRHFHSSQNTTVTIRGRPEAEKSLISSRFSHPKAKKCLFSLLFY
jgi:hypothetical protein